MTTQTTRPETKRTAVTVQCQRCGTPTQTPAGVRDEHGRTVVICPKCYQFDDGEG